MRIIWSVRQALICLAILAGHAVAGPAMAQPVAPDRPTYADLVDLADSAPLVLVAEPRKVLRVEDERAPGLRPGYGRFYVQARTKALLYGEGVIGESLVYLVDLPLDDRGKPPAVKKRDVILFARPVPSRPGELQLVARDAQLMRDEATESTLRAILAALASSDAPARIKGVREIIHVPGNLVGEGETQVFLATEDGSAASITVRHDSRSGVQWGASFSELLAAIGSPPRAGTLEWYRLACFLPNRLPAGANLSQGPQNRHQAEADYRMVLGELGLCERHRR